MNPKNEQGVVSLFSEVATELGYTFKSIGTRCPDAILEKDGKEIRAEFEYLSRNFKQHKHDPDDVDLIICWFDNWQDTPLPVLCLSYYVALRPLLPKRTDEKPPTFFGRAREYWNLRRDRKRKVSRYCIVCGDKLQAATLSAADPFYCEEAGCDYRRHYVTLTCKNCGLRSEMDIIDEEVRQ